MEQIDLTQVGLHEVVTHHVGSKYNEEKLALSKGLTEVRESSKGYLYQYLIKPFEDIYEFHQFAHVDDLALNPVYQLVKHLFNDEANLLDASMKIAEHLFEESEHPNIKAGQMSMIRLSNAKVDNEIVDAYGIFKTESRTPFLTLEKDDEHYEIAHELGLDLKGLDKGCIIFNVNEKKGFKVMLLDKSSRQGLAHFWREHFLQVLPSKNDFNQTASFMNITKSYLNEQVDKDFLLPKADKLDLMNRSLEYFKENEQFNKDQFEDEVFGQKELINSFRQYDQQYRDDLGIDLNDSFTISSPAVKKNARVFRSVLKLDKNFHIYVHGNRDLIERGEEPDGRKFYKLYFDQES